MASKEVADRQKATGTVVAALEQARAILEQRFAKKFRIAPEVTRQFVDGLLGGLREANEALVAADLANESELADDAPFRALRDTKARDLARLLPKIRSDVETHHGELGARELGLDGPTPDDPQLLANHATLVLQRLSCWKRRPSELEGEQFDPQRWASRLETPLAGLQSALAAVATEVAEAKVTVTEKQQKLAENDSTFSSVATLVTALLTAVGEKELARRTRPSARSPGRTTEQDEAPAKELQPTG